MTYVLLKVKFEFDLTVLGTVYGNGLNYLSIKTSLADIKCMDSFVEFPITSGVPHSCRQVPPNKCDFFYVALNSQGHIVTSN